MGRGRNRAGIWDGMSMSMGGIGRMDREEEERVVLITVPTMRLCRAGKRSSRFYRVFSGCKARENSWVPKEGGGGWRGRGNSRGNFCLGDENNAMTTNGSEDDRE